MKRTKLQSKIIHALARQIGISRENYQSLIFNLTNGRTETSAELSATEADDVIKALDGTPPPRGKGVSRRTQQRRRKAAGVITLATSAQLNHLTDLAVHRWGQAHAEKGLERFCSSPKVIGKPKPATSKEANRVIEILKALIKRDAAPKEAA